MERYTYIHTHDYANDTRLNGATFDNGHTELHLIFTSEDVDMGIEEMLYNGDACTITELIHELREELTDYLDRADSDPADRVPTDDYYDDFTRTALYAFESMLMEIEKERKE